MSRLLSRTPGNPFGALSVAILRGFVRDRAAVFFALVFPLMFLVLFGGIFSDQTQSQVDMIEVGYGPAVRRPPGRRAAGLRRHLRRHRTTTASTDAIAQVRKGDADVAVEMQGDTLVAHYTQTDQIKAAITQGSLQAFVDGTNVAVTGEPPRYQLEVERVEDESLDTIQFVTPGLLGWAVAMSAASARPPPCRAGDSSKLHAPAPARAGLHAHRGRRPGCR